MNKTTPSILSGALAGVLALIALPARAVTIVLNPIADTTLQEAFPTSNFGDGTTFQAGGRRQGGRTRGLLLFDIAGNIPAGATITSAALSLSVVAVPNGGVASAFDLHRVLSGWGEGNGSDHGGSPGGANQATWSNRLGSGTPWTAPGGDFSPTVSASRAISGVGAYSFSSTASTVSDVQGWLDTPVSDFGWLLQSQSEVTPTSIRRFGNRTDAANKPALTIQYGVVPEPAALSLSALGLLIVAVRRRPSKPAR